MLKRKHVGRIDIKRLMGRGLGSQNTGLFASNYLKIVLSVISLTLITPLVASAQTAISQGYSTTDSVAQGSIVSLVKNSTDQVVASNTESASNILGIVINSDNSLLSLSSSDAKQVQIATNGIVQVLVSDINGDIHQGDSITASPINGVGMKATINSKIVGIAQDSLTSTNGSNQSYTDKNGKKHTVLLGELPVLVNVSYYYKQPDKTLIPSAIQNIANAVVGKTVSPLPIIVSMGIFIVTLIVVSSIVYSMIKSSIISVGRNPMSQSAIYRDMLQMSALVVGILAVAIISIYLVLSKF